MGVLVANPEPLRFGAGRSGPTPSRPATAASSPLLVAFRSARGSRSTSTASSWETASGTSGRRVSTTRTRPRRGRPICRSRSSATARSSRRTRFGWGMTQTFEMRVSDPAKDSAGRGEAPRATRSAGPRRLPKARKVTLLGLRTSAVTYDFEQADEAGHFSRGFCGEPANLEPDQLGLPPGTVHFGGARQSSSPRPTGRLRSSSLLSLPARTCRFR